MVLVNLQGDAGQAFALLAHAPWNGLTVADLVFPWFLLAVGIAVALAWRPGQPPALGPGARRAALLFVIGVALGWLIRPTLDLDSIRWVGVLQRISVVYLVCLVVAQRSSGARLAAVLAMACLGIHSLGLLAITAPGEEGPSLAMGEGFSAWMDQTFLPGRLHRGTWDPEGAWSTVAAIGTGLLGVAAARLNPGPNLRGPILAGLACIALGASLTPLLPLNKALWTASYALVAAGSGWVVLLGLRAISSRGLGGVPFDLLVFAGQTALTVYVVHMLLIALLVRSPFGSPLWGSGFELIEQLDWPPAWASLIFAILATGLSLAPVPWLRRRGWLIRA